MSVDLRSTKVATIARVKWPLNLFDKRGRVLYIIGARVASASSYYKSGKNGAAGTSSSKLCTRTGRFNSKSTDLALERRLRGLTSVSNGTKRRAAITRSSRFYTVKRWTPLPSAFLALLAFPAVRSLTSVTSRSSDLFYHVLLSHKNIRFSR